MQTIEEVLEYGPICAADMELGFIVTINGAYVNFWTQARLLKDDYGYYPGKNSPGGLWENTDCYSLGKGSDGLYGITAAEMWDIGKESLSNWINFGEGNAELCEDNAEEDEEDE